MTTTPESGRPEGPEILDARRQRCPLPVIRLAALLGDLAPGSLVRLLATDPAARTDVPAFCRMRGHDLIEVEEVRLGGSEHTAYLVRRGA